MGPQDKLPDEGEKSGCVKAVSLEFSFTGNPFFLLAPEFC